MMTYEHVQTHNSRLNKILHRCGAPGSPRGNYVSSRFYSKNAPSLKPHFASNMIGYGSFPYTNYKKEKAEWPVIALANQKNYVSIYICGVIDNEYLAEKYKSELGKVSVGRSCIRFKKLEQVNLPTLKKVIALAAKNPGLVSSH